MVDSVSEVLEIPRSEIEPPPAFGAKIRVDFMHGMGKVAGKFVIILDANQGAVGGRAVDAGPSCRDCSCSTS